MFTLVKAKERGDPLFAAAGESISDVVAALFAGVTLRECDSLSQIIAEIAKKVFKPLLMAENVTAIKQIIGEEDIAQVLFSEECTRIKPRDISSKIPLDEKCVVKAEIKLKKGYLCTYAFKNYLSLGRKCGVLQPKNEDSFVAVTDTSFLLAAVYVTQMAAVALRNRSFTVPDVCVEESLLHRLHKQMDAGKVCICSQNKNDFYVRSFISFMQHKGVASEIVSNTTGRNDITVFNKFQIQQIVNMYGNEIFEADCFQPLAYRDLLEYSSDVRYSSVLFPIPMEFCEKKFDGYNSIIKAAFLSVYDCAIKPIVAEKQFLCNLNHAKAYTDKKTAKILTKEDSCLANYFGKVEVDEDVDMEKFLLYSEKIACFINLFFPGIDLSEHTFRIRHIKNRKASGIYFPTLKCLVVDIDSPEKFVHEFAHLVDYAFGISVRQNKYFLKVKKEFLAYYISLMGSDPAFAEKMRSKRKGNFSYYSNPREIFAMAIECHCARNKLTELIVSDCTDKIYPKGESVQLAINDYVNSLKTEVTT